jgi:hypothetical protein
MLIRLQDVGRHDCPMKTAYTFTDPNTNGAETMVCQAPCNGPACPVWRWYDVDGGPMVNRRGWCGLGGKPD